MLFSELHPPLNFWRPSGVYILEQAVRMSLDDCQLIARLQAGELEALGELFDRHRLRVFRTALAVVRDPAAAEDIAQDVFLRLHAHAGSIDGRLPLLPWLYRVTVNLSCTWVRRRVRWLVPLEDFVERLVSSPRYSPEWQLERSEEWRVVADAMGALPADQRAALALYYLNDLSLIEIAAIVECPVGTVKSRLHYGRETLRRRLRLSDEALSEVVYEFT